MAWDELIRLTTARHDVADVDLAVACGISREAFRRRTARDRWGRPNARVRIPPWASASVQRQVLTACLGTSHLAAASGTTAAWVRGLRVQPPRPAAFVIGHGTRIPQVPRTLGRQARWLEDDDIEEVDAIPTLLAEAMVVSTAHLSSRVSRALLLDLVQANLTTPARTYARIERISTLANRARLLDLCLDLADRVVESIFHDDVLEVLRSRGYRPLLSATRIDTPDGRGLLVDVPLPDWCVAVEPEGDGYHRTRGQRQNDRRRISQYAGTDWRPVLVDWRDWQDRRESVLAAIDAAIAFQRRRGIGAHVEPPTPL